MGELTTTKLLIFASEALRAVAVPGSDPRHTAARAVEFAKAMLEQEPEGFPVALISFASAALARFASPSGDPKRVAEEAWALAEAMKSYGAHDEAA
jgi:hypothetical protein